MNIKEAILIKSLFSDFFSSKKGLSLFKEFSFFKIDKYISTFFIVTGS